MLKGIRSLDFASSRPCPTGGRGLFVSIGLNTIDPAHYGTDGKLVSAEADAAAMATLLTDRGFSPVAGTGVLLGRKATARAILTTIGRLAKEAREGDISVITYAGHGGQLPDRGTEETDRLDETWCAYDRQVIDDEVQLRLCDFRKGVRVVIVSDSCHSGTVARARITAAALQVASADPAYPVLEGVSVPRYRTLDADTVRATYTRNRDQYDTLSAEVHAKLPQGERTPPKASCVSLGACQDKQLAQDGPFNGLFTGTLLSLLPDGYRFSYKALHDLLANRMPAVQIPSLDVAGRPDAGFLDQPFLSV